QIEGFTKEAAIAAGWTRQQLQVPQEGGIDPAERQRFMESLPLKHEEGDFLYVHGSPRDPTREYIFPQEVKDPNKMWAVFRQIKRYCFVGHTHLPGIFTESCKFYKPEELKEQCWPLQALQDRKIICNVGSVGQPRDGNWWACYVLLDDDQKIRFRRVKYDM